MEYPFPPYLQSPNTNRGSRRVHTYTPFGEADINYSSWKISSLTRISGTLLRRRSRTYLCRRRLGKESENRQYGWRGEGVKRGGKMNVINAQEAYFKNALLSNSTEKRGARESHERACNLAEPWDPQPNPTPSQMPYYCMYKSKKPNAVPSLSLSHPYPHRATLNHFNSYFQV